MSNNTVFKTYLPAKQLANSQNKRATHICVEVYYSLGGMNYWNYKVEERGYYVSVTPVEKGSRLIGYIGGQGVKQLLVTCKRKNQKSADLAMNMYKEYLDSLLNYVAEHNGVAVAEEVPV